MDYLDFIKHYQLDPRQNLESNVMNFYRQTHSLQSYRHCLNVAKKAIQLDNWFKEDLYTAGLLHDFSSFIPIKDRLQIAQELQIPILTVEKNFPILLHQKLSAYVAKNCFKIDDNKIINAIACHTTLKKGFNDFDLTLFLADKISWEYSNTPPYLQELEIKLSTSKEAAALVYIDYLIDNNRIKSLHPWLRDAKSQLMEIVKK